MNMIPRMFQLMRIAAIVVGLSSCSEQPTIPTSNVEFADRFSAAWKAGSFDVFEKLAHPDTPAEMHLLTRDTLAPLLKVKPDSVSYTFIALSEVAIDLPGSVGARKLAFTSAVDGVVHLKGTADSGDITIDLYLPFVRIGRAYYLAAVDYSQE